MGKFLPNPAIFSGRVGFLYPAKNFIFIFENIS